MKRSMSLFSLACVGGAIVSVALMQTGCEEAKGLKGLQVDPPSTTLTTNGQVTVFRVTGGITNETLALPLTWRVQDEGLGRITYSSGFSATYQRSERNGVNTVIVRDQYENEGYASVKQSAAAYSLELASTATSISIGESATITISTVSAQAPYTWRKLSGPGAVTGDSGSRSAAYSSSTVGVAVIEVTDANGASGVIAITVAEAGSDGGDGGGGGTDPDLGV